MGAERDYKGDARVRLFPPVTRLTRPQDNILFGAPFDKERYDKVIEQCGLKRDLELFEAGDRTEVGEKGLTLRCVDSHDRRP